MTNYPSPPTGELAGQVHRYALRVFYEDTDAGGVVYHANYLRWFERARSDILELLGIDQRAALESGGGLYTVSEVTIRYLAPARLGDAIWIETTAESVGRASCVMRQKAWCGDKQLTEARVRLGFIGPDGRPRRQPEAWQQAFTAMVSSQASISGSGSIPSAER